MSNAAKEWWRDFFSGLVVDMWLQAPPEEMTRLEAAFIQKMLSVPPPAKLLDAPCGGGRHALVLAASGYQMTGLDISPEFLSAARNKATEQRLAITWQQQSMRDIAWQEEFDGAYCFGNCFGYDDDEANAAYLQAIFHSLKPGARFVLDYPMVLEARVPRFQARNWFPFGDLFFLEDERYDHVSGRIETEYTFLRDGQILKRQASHRCYTFREINGMLEGAGFSDVRAFGTLSEEPFKLGSECLFLVATKKTG